ncbi:TPA: hypothetical protein ACT1UT_002770 [Raoultella planticola]
MNSAALFYFIPQHIDVPTDLSFSGHVLAAALPLLRDNVTHHVTVRLLMLRFLLAMTTDCDNGPHGGKRGDEKQCIKQNRLQRRSLQDGGTH